MKIYVTHSTGFDYETELYQPLRTLRDKFGVIFPHEKGLKPTNTKENIRTFDLVIAEVSYPSTGQGIELGWTDVAGIPIVCVHRDDKVPSSALSLIAEEVIPYSSLDELVTLIRHAVERASRRQKLDASANS